VLLNLTANKVSDLTVSIANDLTANVMSDLKSEHPRTISRTK